MPAFKTLELFQAPIPCSILPNSSLTILIPIVVSNSSFGIRPPRALFLESNQMKKFLLPSNTEIPYSINSCISITRSVSIELNFLFPYLFLLNFLVGRPRNQLHSFKLISGYLSIFSIKTLYETPVRICSINFNDSCIVIFLTCANPI